MDDTLGLVDGEVFRETFGEEGSHEIEYLVTSCFGTW